MVGQRFREALVVVITIVWAVNFCASLLPGRSADPTVNATFMALVGALFALDRKKAP